MAGFGVAARVLLAASGSDPMLRVTALTLGCGLALLGLPSEARSSAASLDGGEPFIDQVEVRVVNVEVYVTDRQGQPVHGLTAADFEVYDDGRRVELSNFFERMGGGARAAESGAATGEPPAAEARERPTLKEPLTLVVYIDNSTLVAAHRNRVLDDVAGFLEAQSGRADLRYGLVSFDSELEVLVPIPSALDPVLEGLEEMRRRRATGLREVVERTQLRRTLIDLHRESGGCTEAWMGMVAAIDGFAQRAGLRVAAAQAGLIGLTRALSALPGRKAILYLSDGLQPLPGLDFHEYIGELCPARSLEATGNALIHDERSLFEELTASANTHSVTFYPLETAGLKPLSLESAEWGPDDRSAGSRDSLDSPKQPPEYGYIPSPRNDQIKDVNYKAGLAIMAKETGGRAIFNANAPRRALDDLAGDFDNCYSLGFAPAAGWDGRRHKIFVRLVGDAGKKRQLRYRTTYQAVSRDEWMAERAIAALVLGLESNPLNIEVGFGASAPLVDEAHQIPLEITLGLDSLTLLGEPAARGLVRVVVVAHDRRNRQSPIREKIIPIELARAALEPEGRHRLVIDLEMQPGEHWIAVAVRDEIGADASYLRRQVSIPTTTALLVTAEPDLTDSGAASR